MLRVFTGIGRVLWGAALLLTASAALAQEPVRIAEYVTRSFEYWQADQEKLGSAPQSTAPGIRAVNARPAPPPMPVEQRNAIGLVYRDFCDPNFGTGYDLSGPVDRSLYEPYRNQLLTRYQGNCTNFFAREVAQIIALRDLEGLLLPAIGKSQLDADGAYMLGMWLFLAHYPDIAVCVGEGEARRQGLTKLSPAWGLVPLGTMDSLSTIATGYGQALGAFIELRQQRRMGGCDLLLTTYYAGMSYRQLTSANFQPAR